MGATGNLFSTPYFNNLTEPCSLTRPYSQDNYQYANLLYLYLYSLLLEVETIKSILNPYLVQIKPQESRAV